MLFVQRPAKAASKARLEDATLRETASDLVRKCVAAMQDGTDFPTVWDTVLKGHVLVIGSTHSGV